MKEDVKYKMIEIRQTDKKSKGNNIILVQNRIQEQKACNMMLLY